MIRNLLTLGVFAILATAQTPDDGLTDSTPAIQKALDSGRARIGGDPLGTGARATAIISNGRITSVSIDSPGERYCRPPDIHIAGTSASAEVDRDCRITAIRIKSQTTESYAAPPLVHITPRPRCYKITQLRIPTGAVLEGDGHSTCLVASDPTRPALYSEGAYGFHLRDFRLEGHNAADTGMQFNGGETGDASLCTLENIEVTGFRQKNIELNRSYGFVFQNVHSHNSGGWGLYLRDGFNNATQVISGEYSGNKIGGVYVGAHSVQFHFSSIAEANAMYGIYYKGPTMGLQIDNAYFEANGRDRKGWDVYSEFTDYDSPTRGLTIRDTLFNSADSEGAAHIQNTVDINLAHNTGRRTILGDPVGANYITIGKGALNLHLEGNYGLAIRNSAGTPIHSETPPDLTNLFTELWPPSISLPLNSGAANPTTLTRTLNLPSGHYAGAGVWLRTAKGTSTAWLEIADRSAVYTGSLVNQPHRQTIDTNWQWISTMVGTDAEAKSPTTQVRLRLYRNDSSDTKLVYVRAPQAWRDIAGTPARSTIQTFSATGSDTRRTSTSEGHSATRPNTPR